MALNEASFISFHQEIHNFWSSERSSLKCTEKEFIHVLIAAALKQTNLNLNEACIGVLIKSKISDFVNSWKEIIPEEELPWLFMYSLQEEEGMNPSISGFDDTLFHHLLSKKHIYAIKCSFISPKLLEFAQDIQIKLIPVVEKIVYSTEEDILALSSPYHLMLSSDWAPKRKGVVLSSIHSCDEISLEAGSFICRNGKYILFDTEEYCDGTLMSDISDGWSMIVPYGNVFTRNISTIRNYFSNGCLRPVETGTCQEGQNELFLSWSDFHPASACDYQIDTNENNMRAAQRGDRFLDQPAIIVNLYNLEVYVHSSRLGLGIPEDIYERSVILVPDYVNSIFCRNSLLQTANDLNGIFSKRDDGFEGFTKYYRKFWIEKACTGRYDMDNPIATIESFMNEPSRKAEFVTLMETLAKIPMKPHKGLDRECADIRSKIQEEYGIDTHNIDDLSVLNGAWAQFWTLDLNKLQKGKEQYEDVDKKTKKNEPDKKIEKVPGRKHKLPPSAIIKEKILRGEWPMTPNPIEDLGPFISKGKRDELLTLMCDIQCVYNAQEKTKPSDRFRIMEAVDKHYGIEYKDRTPAGKAFSNKKYWDDYHRRIWMAFWGMKKEDDAFTEASRKELDYEYLKERINNGEWIA